jgi:hypothetical protein
VKGMFHLPVLHIFLLKFANVKGVVNPKDQGIPLAMD